MILDLDAVRTRHDGYLASHDHPHAFPCCSAHASAGDVPALLAEVERLRRIEAAVRAIESADDPYDEAVARNALHAALKEETR
ncbi:hypothetical protein AMIS_21230 [Actinoplanes missouriensis 431]|uniref:Uncharacterized protein n=1 Tax=Actinoplanes missouriensis (strain ATCC 14538 / DSM 43046 / CBS 188.64 / JCM 3121 / NBRC 102363 / NCIMB 12654 / NRRL B-3342 / UNCC 431) TaxID=512565 RepID=I0H2V6_ACTM4|nr:hypothetical protein [Actinoplanes missouriensis]BAL87343.1 hypothetical protein AMIS_21230 [Actinoplanes missouriensis 431]